MTGTSAARTRVVGIGAGLAFTALLIFCAGQAQAAKYAVAQCGWHVGQDATWSDPNATEKFSSDSFCITPAGSDPFEGARLRSYTRENAGTVGGTRFARWRWSAPAGTGIVNVRGAWWHSLHDGFEQRLGTEGGGGFDEFATASETELAPNAFSAGFTQPRQAFETRLRCSRAEDKRCDLDPPSSAAVRAVTITLEDDSAPQPQISGPLTEAGWRHGSQALHFSGSDNGSGMRFSETLIDGAQVALTEHFCAKAMIGGEWRATRMQPCERSRSGSHTIATAAFSDGPHTLRHCAEDFAGNSACTPSRPLRVDNTAPGSPRGLALVGGTEWRRVNSFGVTWANPDQGVASPIAGAYYRIGGPGGFDSGVRSMPGAGIAAIGNLKVPAAGAYTLAVWLRDGAGNTKPTNAAGAALLFDNIPPAVSFHVRPHAGRPELIRAEVTDANSGPSGGTIDYRRAGSEHWVDLPAALRDAPGGGSELVARFPSDRVSPGSYLLRARAVDAAGNASTTSLRGNGTRMVVRAPLKAPTRLSARLRFHRRSGASLTAPYGAGVVLSGRLTRGGGAPLEGRELSVVVRPAGGSIARGSVRTIHTGRHGAFRLQLGRGPSRRLRVRFAGTEALGASRSGPLLLRVRAWVGFRIRPAALRTGQAVRMSGRVWTRGTALPRRGKLVAIQYFEQGSRRWRPVMVTRTDDGGRFRASYRFRYITGRASIRLRAAALPEAGWPYAPGASASRVLRVHG